MTRLHIILSHHEMEAQKTVHQLWQKPNAAQGRGKSPRAIIFYIITSVPFALYSLASYNAHAQKHTHVRTHTRQLGAWPLFTDPSIKEAKSKACKTASHIKNDLLLFPLETKVPLNAENQRMERLQKQAHNLHGSHIWLTSDSEWCQQEKRHRRWKQDVI